MPESWLGENCVFWPKNGQNTLIKYQSKPENNWLRYECEIKKKNISSYDNAVKYENEFLMAENTEAENE